MLDVRVDDWNVAVGVDVDVDFANAGRDDDVCDVAVALDVRRFGDVVDVDVDVTTAGMVSSDSVVATGNSDSCS